MQELADLLSGNKNKILIIGIGNFLRSDDGAGPRIVEQIETSARVQVINAETNIERYIEPIRNSHADLLLFIDCLSFGKPPGYAALLPVDQITDFSFHSHNISLARIREFFSMPAWVLGIEPASLKVGEKLSPAVEKTAREIVETINLSGKVI